MNTTSVNGALLAAMIKNGAASLKNKVKEVNDLNVFPIPDGDTGDNMFLTIDAGVVALADEPASVGEAARLAANGMLLGARGNSGVILSRIFAGIARGLEGVDEADVRTFHKAMESGVKESYSAVSVPVEGTILTVYRDAVRYAGVSRSEQAWKPTSRTCTTSFAARSSAHPTCSTCSGRQALSTAAARALSISPRAWQRRFRAR